MNPFLLSAICIFGMMIALYILSRFTKDNSIVDTFWGIGFVLTSAVLFFTNSSSVINGILFLMVALWGIRLSVHLGIRNLGEAEDFRYANWRNDWGSTEPWRSFLQVFMLQGSIMFVMCLPIILVLSSPNTGQLTWLHYIGISAFLIGFVVESIADYQKSLFKKHSPDKLMKEGLWSISRHPNYFGEVLLWWGIGLFCVASGFIITGILTPLLINLLIRFVSGVPMLEKTKIGNSNYEEYKSTTPVFIPFLRP